MVLVLLRRGDRGRGGGWSDERCWSVAGIMLLRRTQFRSSIMGGRCSSQCQLRSCFSDGATRIRLRVRIFSA